MFGNFQFWGKYAGDPKGTAIDNGDGTTTYQIVTDSIDDRGSWFAWWDNEPDAAGQPQDPIMEGQQFIFDYEPLPNQVGGISLLWYSGKDVIGSDKITAPGQICIAPEGVDGLRLDFRWWNQVGTAELRNPSLARYIPQIGGGIELPPPINLPELIQVSGIAWEFGFFLVPHMGDNPEVNFPPWPAPGEYMNVQGYAEKDGRLIVLQMLNYPPGG